MYKDIRTAIFDMDGTLLDTIEDIGNAVNIVLENHNYKTHSYSQYKRMIGGGITQTMKLALPEIYALPIHIYMQELRESYKNNLNIKTTVYDGTYELLDLLKELKFNLGIVTNKPHELALKCVDKYFKSYDFKTIGAGHDFETKPSPDSSLYLAKLFSEQSKKCYFIGDSDVDMYTSKNANMVAVGATWGFRSSEELKTAGADLLFDTPFKFLEHIKKNNFTSELF